MAGGRIEISYRAIYRASPGFGDHVAAARQIAGSTSGPPCMAEAAIGSRQDTSIWNARSNFAASPLKRVRHLGSSPKHLPTLPVSSHGRGDPADDGAGEPTATTTSPPSPPPAK